MEALILLVVLIAAAVILIAVRPSHFRIERAVTIKAPPERIFRLVSDFRAWTEWSPWEKTDPHMQRTYAGPPSGLGAVYSWEGNKKVGAGRMTIVNFEPHARIDTRLEFFRPWQATNASSFTFTPAGGDETRVTWAMEGDNGFMAKVFGIFMNMDKLIGRDFEKGLANMKAKAESAV